MAAVRMAADSCKGRWLLAALLGQLALLSWIGPTWGRGGLQRSMQENLDEAADTTLNAKLQRANKLYLNNLEKRSQAIANLGNPSNFSVVNLMAIYFNPVYPCPLEGRIGTWEDGGKWVCLEHRRSETWGEGRGTAVSIGCRGETSFESDMFTRLGMAPHTFDFSLTPKMQADMGFNKFMKFYNLGLSGRDLVPRYKKLFPNATFVTIQELVELTGSSYIDVFKIDCESCEFGVVEDMAQLYTRDTVPFGQIQMEVHFVFTNWGKASWAKRIQESVDKTLKLLSTLEDLGYRMFHAEINMLYPVHYEIALIHEKLTLPPSLGPLPPPALAAALKNSAPSDLLRACQQYVINSKSKWSPHKMPGVSHYILVYMVPEYPCAAESRFGNWGLGGKWVCGVHKRMDRTPVLVSISSADEFSFENEVSKRLHGDVHVLSPPTTKASPLKSSVASLLRFFTSQLSGTMSDKDAADPLEVIAGDLTLASSISTVQGAYVDILNIDCKGCEVRLLDEMMASYNRSSVPFGQVILKAQGTPTTFAPTLKVFTTLKSLGFALFHVELYEAFNPKDMKQVLYWAELSFIHESII